MKKIADCKGYNIPALKLSKKGVRTARRRNVVGLLSKRVLIDEVKQMAKEVWEEIQAAEAEARRIIEDAKLKRNNEIRDARQKALDIIALAEQNTREEGKRLLAEQSVNAAADQKARLEAITAEIRQLSAKGKRRVSGAVKMIVEKVVN